VMIAWDNLPSDPLFGPADAGSDDPFFLIHTNPETDGFFFSIELYTTGYGTAWTGELGDVEVSCSDPSTTGICPYYDEDGPGPIDVLGSDFATTGSITINQLDDSGYDIVVNEIVFSDGTTIGSFRMTG